MLVLEPEVLLAPPRVVRVIVVVARRRHRDLEEVGLLQDGPRRRIAAARVAEDAHAMRKLSVTMSWGWRFGGPSSQARLFHRLLEQWGRENGVRVDVRPEDLVRPRRRSSHDAPS